MLSLITHHSSLITFMISPSSFLYEERDGVAYLTLNRPERLNALTFEVYRELTDTFSALRDESAVRAVGTRGGEARPPSIAARPVEPAHLFAANERAVIDRFVPAPRAARTAIVRNARLGTAAGAREY